MDLTCADHACKIDCRKEEVKIAFPSLREMRFFGRSNAIHLRHVKNLLKRNPITLRVSIGNRKPFEVYPAPSWLIRLLSPQVRQLLQTEE